MERLKVRFSDSTDSNLGGLSSDAGVSKSDVARAAMQIGLVFLNEYEDSQESSFMGLTDFIKLKSLDSLK
tara:strand:- start:849 stop:1058 length:210 start_codon:yes stop_codon:yes gene_type:complete